MFAFFSKDGEFNLKLLTGHVYNLCQNNFKNSSDLLDLFKFPFSAILTVQVDLNLLYKLLNYTSPV